MLTVLVPCPVLIIRIMNAEKTVCPIYARVVAI